MRRFRALLSQRQQQLLAYMLLLLFSFAVISSYFSAHSHYDESLSTRLYQHSVMQRKVLLLEQAESRPQAQTEKLYLRGTTTAIAAANLQKDVQILIASNDGEVLSVQALRGRKEEGTPGISVRFKASHQGLRNVLHHLETTLPLLIVDELQLSHNKQRQDEGELDVRLHVSGFLAEEGP